MTSVTNASFMTHEDTYPDFPYGRADEHLSRAITFRTTGYVDTARVRYEEFDAMQDWLERAFPAVMGAGSVEKVGHSLLIRIPGTDGSLEPAMFIAHQDTVPIVPGTEGDWKHDPYAGDIADGYIWGRGAIDIKQMLIAELETAEYLLEQGRRPARALCFAFGEDEETLNTGAWAIGQKLKAEGVRLAMVMDEGIPETADGAAYGAPGITICPIGISEKGYADMYLRAHSRGGHSSDPVDGTSLGHLAKAITQIVEAPPEPVLAEYNVNTLRLLQPVMSVEPIRTWAADPQRYRAELTAYFAAQPQLYYLVQTTVAPTMISGGSDAGNVMPQNMEAVINFRLCPQDTTDSLLAYVRGLIDPAIETGYVQCINASIPSDTDTEAFAALTEALSYYYRDIRFYPTINRGCTDAHNYECICRCCYRIEPFIEENEVHAEGMHGTNERISLKAYHQGIRVLLRLMERFVFDPDRGSQTEDNGA